MQDPGWVLETWGYVGISAIVILGNMVCRSRGDDPHPGRLFGVGGKAPLPHRPRRWISQRGLGGQSRVLDRPQVRPEGRRAVRALVLRDSHARGRGATDRRLATVRLPSSLHAFFPGCACLAGPVAGITGLRPVPFFLANVLGASLYVPAAVGIGYAIGLGWGGIPHSTGERGVAPRVHRLDLCRLRDVCAPRVAGAPRDPTAVSPDAVGLPERSVLSRQHLHAIGLPTIT